MPEDPKELELPEGTRLRSLQVESETLGLVGKIDVCEGTGDGLEVIDHKEGSARRGENGERVAKEYDAIQVGAYALLLREMGHSVGAASIYYAADRRRVPVALNEELFGQVHRLLAEAREMAAGSKCPRPLRDDGADDAASLFSPKPLGRDHLEARSRAGISPLCPHVRRYAFAQRH